MATQITYNFSVQPTGLKTPNQVSALLSSVAIDYQTLQFWGLRVTSDSTAVVGGLATRTIIVAMGPSMAAAATATLDASVTPSDITAIAVGTNGLDYIRPPVVTIADTAPGKGAGAFGYAQLAVYGVSVGGMGGTGYVAGTTTVTASGGELAPGGKQGTFGAIIFAGSITNINVLTNGGPYNVPPTLTIVDTSGGSGATATARLGVSAVVLTNGGKGYSNPAVAFTPWFKSINPDTVPNAQIASVQSWMQKVIESKIGCAVQPALGIVA